MTFACSMNDGSATSMGMPACISHTVSVGAVYDANLGSVTFGCTDPTTAADKVTCFSNSNETTDVFAPGAAITSDFPGGGLSTFFGTSQASPHAAGCAATSCRRSPSPRRTRRGGDEGDGQSRCSISKNGLVFPRIDCLAALHALRCGGQDCDDGNFCNGSEQCSGGDCFAGSVPACDDASSCTTDACGSDVVVYRDDFESGGSGWTHAGVNDSWHLASTACFATALPGTMYVSNGNAGVACVANSKVERSRLLSPAIALPTTGTLTLSFDALSYDEAGRCFTSAEPDNHDVRITTDNAATYTTLNQCTRLADGTGTVFPPFDVTAGRADGRSSTSQQVNALNATRSRWTT
jgi:hypothetical protein